ncbi:PAS-domain containing protein [Bartonella sp. HY329]|uniref:sensor histidine kinase n=1 Tax=unclassified Bartonella TaxID=2645622 RepID=UPI0021C83859|nr:MULTISPECIES: PAS domain-containing sensor histidine kinase [unclassified Bartonella]UXM95768.1 PAS-domain containing protein [Bartonella sp. HY329]UXN10093.1 PAS-domain containing protein [Bartonella sp. HY328]
MLSTATVPAFAAITPLPSDDLFSVLQLALMGGALLTVGVIALKLRQIAKEKKALEINLKDSKHFLSTLLNPYESYLNLSGQCLVILEGDNAKIAGRLPDAKDVPATTKGFLDWQSWMSAQSFKEYQNNIALLAVEGEAFEMPIATQHGSTLQVCGYANGARLLVSFRDMTKTTTEFLNLKNRCNDFEAKLSALQALGDEVTDPIWIRDRNGDIDWGNRAYFRVAGPDHEIFNAAFREKIASDHRKGEIFKGRTTTAINGERRVIDVTAITSEIGEAGIANDQTEGETLRNELKRVVQGYSETFDQLSTAVAIFNPDQKLEFFNQAFSALWPLDVAFLESQPSHALVLDRLRERGILNETPHWRQWKEELFEAYRSLEPKMTIWNLPDGRTLRVIANPHPQGGVTWLYEDLTEKLNLEARYNSLIRIQGETLDNLYEGVAVFGSDGLMRLSNPAFAAMWALPVEICVEGTHISKIEAFAAPQAVDEDWNDITAAITDFADKRDSRKGRIDLKNGAVADYALVPLPLGQTMLTFVDVTDSINIARALHEKNEALEIADRLRNEFVSHVSYELRTPLTNIIGFTDLLRTPAFGELDARQHDYLSHIASESVELLNIVNDILDLATVDAGIMELDIGDVNILEVMQSAASRVEERLLENNIQIDLQIANGLVSFQADGARIRQVLFNILSNAANYAPQNSTIGFAAFNDENDIIFVVHDDGGGIPEEIVVNVFKRFSTHIHHGTKPGAGLGLSIVKSFVELHNGTVEIDTGSDKGTTVICRFPTKMPALTSAAE